MSEAWFYVNGTPVDMSCTARSHSKSISRLAYKPGETNELLVATRDWLAYSPKNQERPSAVTRWLCGRTWWTWRRTRRPTGWIRQASVAGRAACGLGRRRVCGDERKGEELTLKYRLVNKTGQAQAATVAPKVFDEAKISRSSSRSRRPSPPTRPSNCRSRRSGGTRDSGGRMTRTSMLWRRRYAAGGRLRSALAAVRIPRVRDRRLFLCAERVRTKLLGSCANAATSAILPGSSLVRGLGSGEAIGELLEQPD